jgi:hypothetical protein
MLTSLKEIYKMLESLNNSITNKEEKLIKYLDDPIFGGTFRRVLEYISYDKYIFGLKQIKYCVYFEDPIAAEHQNVDSIFEMLDYLNQKEGDPSDDEISFLEKISSSDVETVEVVVRILNKINCCGLTNERVIEILERELPTRRENE